jgi:hypothetical protein
MLSHFRDPSPQLSSPGCELPRLFRIHPLLLCCPPPTTQKIFLSIEYPGPTISRPPAEMTSIRFSAPYQILQLPLLALPLLTGSPSRVVHRPIPQTTAYMVLFSPSPPFLFLRLTYRTALSLLHKARWPHCFTMQTFYHRPTPTCCCIP